MKDTRNFGFTIVELLIVIVVIGILAALVLNTFSGVQTRARATAVAQGIKAAEKSFNGYMAGEGYSSWPEDNELNGTSNPHLDDLAADTDFGQYMQQVPEVNGLDSLYFTYDNDGDSYGGCAGDNKGVNIGIYNLPRDVAIEIDKTIDDGDLSCGKARYLTDRMFYNISESSTLQ
jgi:prepilin-type N-terminal cleavage/methylation domain-containing protein